MQENFCLRIFLIALDFYLGDLIPTVTRVIPIVSGFFLIPTSIIPFLTRVISIVVGFISISTWVIPTVTRLIPILTECVFIGVL